MVVLMGLIQKYVCSRPGLWVFQYWSIDAQHNLQSDIQYSDCTALEFMICKFLRRVLHNLN